ncbi:MAG: sodium:proton exchanger [Geobacteraceae bacterium GWC2_55_20]|nr:MAG: sodium:proton exchanger [Geobacteraceae bacterium GWC2_55_20]HCE66326.1 sodium:proton exchanger [Geobacter sp.]
MPYEALKDIEILFGLALVTVVLFRRLKFPSIIGFLVTGILAGPHALAFIKNTHQVEQMAEIGVVLLLFTIGIELSLKELMRIKHLVLWGGGLQVLVTILAVAAVGAVFGFPLNQAVFFGFLVALSSTAILMKLLIDSGQADAPHGKMAMGILIFQDLCIVPLMLLTPLLAGGGDGIRGVLVIGGKAAAVVLAAHYGARFLVPWIFKQVVKTRSRELFILTIIFIGLGTAWLTAMAGLSLALGAFIAGLAISESEYSHQALSDIIPFREAFMSLFFISVGMLLDPAILVRYPLLTASLVLTIVLIKTLITTGAALTLGVPMRIAIIAALSLAQIGEFSFVFSQAGVKFGLLTPEYYQIFLAASIATMGLTPVCLKFASPLADRIVAWLPHKLTRGRGVLSQHEKPVLLNDHVIIVGYGINGKNLARVLKNLKIQHIVIETNPFTVKKEGKKGQQIMFGDASKLEVLEHAQIAKARGMVVAISDAAASRRVASLARQLNPALHIIVRTRYLLEVEPLYKLGVNEVIPEEFETSIEILSRVLRNYMVPHSDIERCIAEVRSDGYDMLRSMSRRHSHAVGISGYLSGAEIATYRVKAKSPLEGEGLREGTIRKMSGATVLVIKRGEEVVPNPDPVWELQVDDILLLLGTPEQLAVAGRLFEPSVA